MICMISRPKHPQIRARNQLYSEPKMMASRKKTIIRTKEAQGHKALADGGISSVLGTRWRQLETEVISAANENSRQLSNAVPEFQFFPVVDSMSPLELRLELCEAFE
jgi:hypothetical protein